MPLMRLDKFISGQMSSVSRNDAKELLKKGLVTVDGAVVKRYDHKLDPEKSVVAVSGNVITYREHLYIMLNKPSGVGQDYANGYGASAAGAQATGAFSCWKTGQG